MDNGILTAIIGVVGTLFGTALGWILNCVSESRNKQLKLAFVLQPNPEAEPKLNNDVGKTKYSESGYCIYCYNIGQVPFMYDNFSMYLKKETIIDCPNTESYPKAVMPFEHYVYTLNEQEYDAIQYHCKTKEIKKCSIIAYDISGKHYKTEFDLFLPSMQISVYDKSDKTKKRAKK